MNKNETMPEVIFANDGSFPGYRDYYNHERFGGISYTRTDLLDELKRDKERLMHIFRFPFNHNGFPWRTREEIDAAMAKEKGPQ